MSENNQEKPILSRAEEEKRDESPRGFWSSLDDLRKKGLHKNPIDEITPIDHNLSSGNHYYVISDVAKREVTCTVCKIRHGGILEAHLLARYEVRDGVIYLDGVPKTRKATIDTQ